MKKLSRPYLELKIVKVRKDKYKINRSLYCPCCNSKLEPEKPKGNWVNGENLDKIKFPCFCGYSNKNEKGIGFFSMNDGHYYINNINFQTKNKADVDDSFDLKKFIIKNNIHILKGKIILYEEEK